MNVEFGNLQVGNIMLVYRTDDRTKWLLEVLTADGEERLKIYLSRPANETKNRLTDVLKNYANLHALLREKKPGA